MSESDHVRCPHIEGYGGEKGEKKRNRSSGIRERGKVRKTD